MMHATWPFREFHTTWTLRVWLSTFNSYCTVSSSLLNRLRIPLCHPGHVHVHDLLPYWVVATTTMNLFRWRVKGLCVTKLHDSLSFVSFVSGLLSLMIFSRQTKYRTGIFLPPKRASNSIFFITEVTSVELYCTVTASRALIRFIRTQRIIRSTSILSIFICWSNCIQKIYRSYPIHPAQDRSKQTHLPALIGDPKNII